MTQSHLVKRGSKFYFRIAVPLRLTKLVGKREIKASLRTSDALSAKMRGRVLSNGLELIFREMRAMADISTGVVLDRAKTYFKEQLSKSLEHAFLLPTDPLCNIDFEIVGTEQLAAEMRDALKKQHFSPSVQSDARALLNECPLRRGPADLENGRGRNHFLLQSGLLGSPGLHRASIHPISRGLWSGPGFER